MGQYSATRDRRGRRAGGRSPWRRRLSGADASAEAVRGARHVILYGGCLHETGWRHPQMPVWTVAPDLSNRWDRLRHLSFRSGATCTMLPQALAPGFYKKLGSGGVTRIRIEHRRHAKFKCQRPLRVRAVRPFSKAIYALTQDTQASAQHRNRDWCSRLRNRISFRFERRGFTAMRSKPTTLPLSRISR